LDNYLKFICNVYFFRYSAKISFNTIVINVSWTYLENARMHLYTSNVFDFTLYP